jgi:hypothetical protein
VPVPLELQKKKNTISLPWNPHLAFQPLHLVSFFQKRLWNRGQVSHVFAWGGSKDGLSVLRTSHTWSMKKTLIGVFRVELFWSSKLLISLFPYFLIPLFLRKRVKPK